MIINKLKQFIKNNKIFYIRGFTIKHLFVEKTYEWVMDAAFCAMLDEEAWYEKNSEEYVIILNPKYDIKKYIELKSLVNVKYDDVTINHFATIFNQNFYEIKVN